MLSPQRYCLLFYGRVVLAIRQTTSRDAGHASVLFSGSSVRELISDDVLDKWFYKVNSPTNCQFIVYYDELKRRVDDFVGESTF